ncbi:TIGR04133 family radical SAM/SPASM protein [Proteiniphilum sp. UBA5384]|uniref:TIGR04133 family radical SAM/SPASM protein n=1 Tax=Proteiniphilum sp. UBA5384 TaxID=1947279 RepID=UPI0025E56570|nr:TIGR04133 family radical SAM/SPASM protein [Proteiniphilum sp. UBA5384]
MNPKKRLILSIYQQHKAVQMKQHKLSCLFWECTLRCDSNCVYSDDSTKEAVSPDMPKEDFLKILADIRPHINPNKTMIVLTGGEPLMREDLEECGKAIYEMGYPWGLVTNGWDLEEKKLQSLLEAGLRSITVNLDGYTEESHDWFRGKKGSWLHALNATSRVASTPDLAHDVATSVNKVNINELTKLRELLISLDVTHWRLFTVFPKGGANNNPLLQLSPEEFREMMNFIRDTRRQGRIKVSYGCEGYLGDYEMEVRDNPFFCQAGINIASILANGDISACSGLSGNYVQGNIYQDDFWTTWNTRFQIMRDRSWTKTGKCASCKSYKYCQGNGLHFRDEKTGKLLQCHLEMLGINPCTQKRLVNNKNLINKTAIL